MLHQGLNHKIYHFHLALVPPKPISAMRVEELVSLEINPGNPSPTVSAGSKRKSPIPEDIPGTKTIATFPLKKKKIEVGLTQSSMVAGLYELKSKKVSKLTAKKKGKNVSLLLRVLLVSEEGKFDEEKYSKGDTMVGDSFELGVE